MSSSPKISANYPTNSYYQQSSYGTTTPPSSTTAYSLLPTHHHSQLVNPNPSSNNSLSMAYAQPSVIVQQQQQQQQATSSSSPSYGTNSSSLNGLHTLSPTRYQSSTMNDKNNHHSNAPMANGQVTNMSVNNVTNSAAALAAATAYRRNYSACAKPPYRYFIITREREKET